MSFETAIERVLSHEGGYVNDPNDPGGETNWGISKRAYPDVDIKNLTREQAIAIYKRDYWDKVAGAQLHEDIAYQVLDFAVNSGGPVAIQYLQRAAGAADDGYIGPATIEAVNKMPMPVLILIYIALRQKYQVKLKAWKNFSAGWASRNADNMLLAAQDLLT